MTTSHSDSKFWKSGLRKSGVRTIRYKRSLDMGDGVEKKLPVGIYACPETQKLTTASKPQVDLDVFQESLRATVEGICKSIVDHPHRLQVTVERGEKTTILAILPDPKDFGKIVGKKGRNIAALRHLVECMGARYGIRAIISSVHETSSIEQYLAA